ncbi:hypothetical protein [Bordetella sp. 2513F-2]
MPRQSPALVQSLPDFDNRVVWTDDERSAHQPDLVIHLIEPSYLQADPAVNPQGSELEPDAAMRRAFRRGDKEIALVLGRASSIPQKRYGCWIASGSRSAMDALGIIARTLLGPALDPDSRHRWNLHDLAEANLLCVLGTESADDHETLARQVIAALDAVLGLSHAAPARIVVTASQSVIAHIASSYPVDAEKVHLVRADEADDTLSADMIVAYPWPVGLLK